MTTPTSPDPSSRPSTFHLPPSTPSPVGPGGAGQTFLVGGSIYLSPIELADAATAALWRPSLFPQPPDVVEEKLKEEIPAAAKAGERTLIARRRGDDHPVGSVTLTTKDARWANVELHVPPVHGPEAVSRVTAEMIAVFVPWLLTEREHMVVWLQIIDPDVTANQAAEAVGMRRCWRFREAKVVAGVRRDLVGYQALRPSWVERLGAPTPSPEGAVERETRHPAPKTYARRAQDPPTGAVLVGERLYLRAVTETDREALARWTMAEPETFHDDGRWPRSPISHGAMHLEIAKQEPPEWLRFALVTLDGDRLIGANGLADIDWVHKTAETETEIAVPEFRGGGYGTEAKHLALEYGFDVLGLHMVFSGAWTFNTRSCAALRKQGYRDAGGESWTGFKDGAMADDTYFDLLATEWRAARDAQP